MKHQNPTTPEHHRERLMFEALTLLNRPHTQTFMKTFCRRILESQKTAERRKAMIENLRGTHNLPSDRIDAAIEFLDQHRCR